MTAIAGSAPDPGVNRTSGQHTERSLIGFLTQSSAVLIMPRTVDDAVLQGLCVFCVQFIQVELRDSGHLTDHGTHPGQQVGFVLRRREIAET